MIYLSKSTCRMSPSICYVINRTNGLFVPENAANLHSPARIGDRRRPGLANWPMNAPILRRPGVLITPTRPMNIEKIRTRSKWILRRQRRYQSAGLTKQQYSIGRFIRLEVPRGMMRGIVPLACHPCIELTCRWRIKRQSPIADQ